MYQTSCVGHNQLSTVIIHSHSAAGNLAILILYLYLYHYYQWSKATESAVGHELTPCLGSTCIVNDSMASDITILPSSKDLCCAVCTSSPKHLSWGGVFYLHSFKRKRNGLLSVNWGVFYIIFINTAATFTSHSVIPPCLTLFCAIHKPDS